MMPSVAVVGRGPAARHGDLAAADAAERQRAGVAERYARHAGARKGGAARLRHIDASDRRVHRRGGHRRRVTDRRAGHERHLDRRQSRHRPSRNTRRSSKPRDRSQRMPHPRGDFITARSGRGGDGAPHAGQRRLVVEDDAGRAAILMPSRRHQPSRSTVTGASPILRTARSAPARRPPRRRRRAPRQRPVCSSVPPAATMARTASSSERRLPVRSRICRSATMQKSAPPQ